MARMNWGREQELSHLSFLLDTRKVFQLGSEEPSGSQRREYTGLDPSFPQSRQYHIYLIHFVSLRYTVIKGVSLKQNVGELWTFSLTFRYLY